MRKYNLLWMLGLMALPDVRAQALRNALDVVHQQVGFLFMDLDLGDRAYMFYIKFCLWILIFAIMFYAGGYALKDSGRGQKNRGIRVTLAIVIALISVIAIPDSLVSTIVDAYAITALALILGIPLFGICYVVFVLLPNTCAYFGLKAALMYILAWLLDRIANNALGTVYLIPENFLSWVQVAMSACIIIMIYYIIRAIACLFSRRPAEEGGPRTIWDDMHDLDYPARNRQPAQPNQGNQPAPAPTGPGGTGPAPGGTGGGGAGGPGGAGGGGGPGGGGGAGGPGGGGGAGGPGGGGGAGGPGGGGGAGGAGGGAGPINVNATANSNAVAQAAAISQAMSQAVSQALAQAAAMSSSQAQAISQSVAQAVAQAVSQSSAQAQAAAAAQAQALAQAVSQSISSAVAQAAAQSNATAQALAQAIANSSAEARAHSEAIAQAISQAMAQSNATAQALAEAIAQALARNNVDINIEAIIQATAQASARAEASARATARAIARAVAKAMAEVHVRVDVEAIAAAVAKAVGGGRGDINISIDNAAYAAAESIAVALGGETGGGQKTPGARLAHVAHIHVEPIKKYTGEVSTDYRGWRYAIIPIGFSRNKKIKNTVEFNIQTQPKAATGWHYRYRLFFMYFDGLRFRRFTPEQTEKWYIKLHGDQVDEHLVNDVRVAVFTRGVLNHIKRVFASKSKKSLVIEYRPNRFADLKGKVMVMLSAEILGSLKDGSPRIDMSSGYYILDFNTADRKAHLEQQLSFLQRLLNDNIRQMRKRFDMKIDRIKRLLNDINPADGLLIATPREQINRNSLQNVSDILHRMKRDIDGLTEMYTKFAVHYLDPAERTKLKDEVDQIKQLYIRLMNEVYPIAELTRRPEASLNDAERALLTPERCRALKERSEGFIHELEEFVDKYFRLLRAGIIRKIKEVGEEIDKLT
ncbi:hypothetical protein JW968_06430 [Candidatus Woesearchaeota archaeon]|nr:hypothetical protein [Candidatus Woesearchaeota archaeon]